MPGGVGDLAEEDILPLKDGGKDGMPPIKIKWLQRF